MQIDDLHARLRAGKVETDEDDVLALMLIREKYQKGKESRWYTHIAALPLVVDNPFFYTDEEVQAFKGTNFFPIAKTMREQGEKRFAEIEGVIKAEGDKVGFPSSVFTLERFLWAMGMVWSRFVSLKLDR